MEGSVKVQDDKSTPEQFAEGLEKLHEMLRTPGITTAMVIVTTKDQVTSGCLGAPIDIIAGVTSGATQIINVARKNITIVNG